LPLKNKSSRRSKSSMMLLKMVELRVREAKSSRLQQSLSS
jgi:hypothetical protein